MKWSLIIIIGIILALVGGLLFFKMGSSQILNNLIVQKINSIPLMNQLTIGDASKIPIWSVQFTGNESILYSLESLDNNQICIMPNDKDLKDIQVQPQNFGSDNETVAQDDILSSSITYKYPTTLKQYTGITENSKSLVTSKDLLKDRQADGSICYTLDPKKDAYYIGESTIIIIKINNAEHLDENRVFIENIYPLVNSRDYIYASIPDKHYVRVTFESNLTSENDITIYARSNSSANVQVYEKDSDILLADFGAIKDDGMYKIFLTNLKASQDTFDLKVSGGSIDFDYIVDPNSWQRDKNINASLPGLGSNSAPNIFYKDSTWYMIAGGYYGLFYGFNWTGSAWQKDWLINASLPDIGSYSVPNIFYKDSTWYIIAGANDGTFYGFNWTGSAWQTDNLIKTDLPDIGSNSAPNIFYKDSTWYMIAGEYKGVFYGFNWTGSAWQRDKNINASLPDIGSNSAPNIFYKDSTWYMIAGEYYGLFYGFNWTGSPDITSPTYSNAQTNNTIAGQSTNFSLYVSDDNPLYTNGQYVFSTNNTGTWMNDSPVNFTTFSTVSQWANITKTLNSTGGIFVSYRWYLNDSAGNNNNTGVYNVTITGAQPSNCWSCNSATHTLYIPNGCVYYIPSGSGGYC